MLVVLLALALHTPSHAFKQKLAYDEAPSFCSGCTPLLPLCSLSHPPFLLQMINIAEDISKIINTRVCSDARVLTPRLGVPFVCATHCGCSHTATPHVRLEATAAEIKG